MKTFTDSRRRPLPTLVFRLLALCSALMTTGGAADVIYRSVNADGHVTFADDPLANATEVELIDLTPSSNAVGAFDQDTTETQAAMLTQMIAVTERLRQDRLAREASRNDRRDQRQPTPAYEYPAARHAHPDYHPDYPYYPSLYRPYAAAYLATGLGRMHHPPGAHADPRPKSHGHPSGHDRVRGTAAGQFRLKAASGARGPGAHRFSGERPR